MNIRVPRWLHYGISILIAIGLFYAIFHQFDKTEAIGQFQTYTTDFRKEFDPRMLLLALLLVPLNWGLEAVKWQILVPQSSLKEAARVVLGGLSWSIWTPLGIGDYVGRGYIQQNQRVRKTSVHTFVASITQNFGNAIWAILLVGLVDPSWKNLWGIPWWNYSFVLLLCALCAFLILPNSLVDGIPSKDQRMKLQLWSLLRSFVYLTQYGLILMAFGSKLPFSMILMLVSVVYIWQSGIPVPEALGIVIKVELAILIFSYEGINELLAVLSALSIWIINRLVPALVGYIGILKMSKDESTIHF